MSNYCCEYAIRELDTQMDNVFSQITEVVLYRNATFLRYLELRVLLAQDLDVDTIKCIVSEGGLPFESFFTNVDAVRSKREWYAHKVAKYATWISNLTNTYLKYHKTLGDYREDPSTLYCTCGRHELDTPSSTPSLESDNGSFTLIGTSGSVYDEMTNGGVHATPPTNSTNVAANWVAANSDASSVGRNVVSGGEEEDEMSEEEEEMSEEEEEMSEEEEEVILYRRAAWDNFKLGEGETAV